jgi:LytS/YehU family sensor histidine kinase
LIWFNKLVFDQPHNYLFTFQGWLVSFIVTLVIGGLGSFYRFAIDWFTNLGLKEKMTYLQLKSEIHLLKSKLNPHFMFNTLNNIDALIETDSKSASVYLGKLSTLLRYIVYDTENEEVDIEREINCIKEYVELQKLRLVNKDAIKLIIIGNYKGYKIAPALMLPLVENIFKHGQFETHESKSEIRISFDKGILQFTTSNPSKNQQFEVMTNSGMGIDTTRKRLELLYPGMHRFEIKKVKDIFHVSLHINLNDN